MSARLRVKTRPRLRRRCTWMRAPSSFHSTYVRLESFEHRPRRRRPSARASGRSGAAGSAGTRASPSPPSRIATSATEARSPASIAARRTSAAGTPAAFATASAMTPSSAPCRSSPRNKPTRRRCSGSVARAKSAASSSRRAPWEPLPAIDCEARHGRVDLEQLERRLGRRRGLLAERRPPHADGSLRQLARQIGDRDSDLLGRRRTEALGDALDLREPRRRRRDVSRRRRYQREEHPRHSTRSGAQPDERSACGP